MPTIKPTKKAFVKYTLLIGGFILFIIICNMFTQDNYKQPLATPDSTPYTPLTEDTYDSQLAQHNNSTSATNTDTTGNLPICDMNTITVCETAPQ